MSKYRDRFGNPTIYSILGRNLTGEELATLAGSQGNIERELDSLQAGGGSEGSLPFCLAKISDLSINWLQADFQSLVGKVMPFTYVAGNNLVSNGIFTPSSSGIWRLQGVFSIELGPFITEASDLYIDVALWPSDTDLNLYPNFNLSKNYSWRTIKKPITVTESEFYIAETFPVDFTSSLNQNED